MENGNNVTTEMMFAFTDGVMGERWCHCFVNNGGGRKN